MAAERKEENLSSSRLKDDTLYSEEFFVADMFSFLGDIQYPTVMYDDSLPDRTLDWDLASLFRYAESADDKQIVLAAEKLLIKAAVGEYYPNCWQAIFLINLSANPLLLKNNYVTSNREIADNLEDGWGGAQYRDILFNPKKKEMSITMESKQSPVDYPQPCTIDQLNQQPFGSTVFLFGTAHVCMLTRDGKALSHWESNKVSIASDTIGFKEVALTKLVEKIFSSPLLLYPAIDVLLMQHSAVLSETQITWLQEIQEKIHERYINQINTYDDNPDEHTAFIDKIKIWFQDLPFISYTPPLLTQEGLQNSLFKQHSYHPTKNLLIPLAQQFIEALLKNTASKIKQSIRFFDGDIELSIVLKKIQTYLLKLIDKKITIDEFKKFLNESPYLKIKQPQVAFVINVMQQTIDTIKTTPFIRSNPKNPKEYHLFAFELFAKNCISSAKKAIAPEIDSLLAKTENALQDLETGGDTETFMQLLEMIIAESATRDHSRSTILPVLEALMENFKCELRAGYKPIKK